MKVDIIKVLRECDGYISGQQLCNELGVSRTAIWKVIEQLRQQGYVIEAVKNKGYHLVSAPDLFRENEIASRLETDWAGKTLHFFKETGSTNNDCRRYLEEGNPHGTLVVADSQNMGKGRRGRGWISPPGTTISMSIGLKPAFSPDKASMLTLVMALAVQKAVSQIAGVTAMIKWPNDIVVNKKKVCGILTEMNAQPDYIEYVIIGVGINVNQTSFDQEIANTASSLLVETGEEQSRSEIVAKTMDYFEQYYEIFEKTCDLSALLEDYNEVLVNRDAKVRVLDPKGEFDGIARGINEAGELMVETEDGQMTNVYAGEVSVRGIYGYV